MRSQPLISLLSVIALLLCNLTAYSGEEAAVGKKAPALELPDQHDKNCKLDASTRVVIIAFHMGVAKSFNKWLNAREKDWLKKRNAIYVADISGMPSTIAKMFAVPKMRKYKHQILLNRADEFASKFPVEKEKATVLRINKSGMITSISHIASPESLPRTLGE